MRLPYHSIGRLDKKLSLVLDMEVLTKQGVTMCGIVGYLDKCNNEQAPVGQIIFKMLKALGRRGPDSAGVAVYGHGLDGDLVLRVKLGEQAEPAPVMPASGFQMGFGNQKRVSSAFEEKAKAITRQAQKLGPVGEASTTAEYLRLVLDY